MNTNKKIAKWLGWISEMEINQGVVCIADKDIKNAIEVELDFLHDRNQQKWIEDKLIELGYEIKINQDKEGTLVQIGKEPFRPIASGENKSKDLAFISAVEQLIDKTNENKIM